MRKQILLIGNTNDLPGVNIDIRNYRDFFKSPFGGSWFDNEIIEHINSSAKEIKDEIINLKNLKLDYLIVIFSGHGGYIRETILELNADEECIDESELNNIADRQLNIYDCCRSELEPIFESAKSRARTLMFSAYDNREKYENRIMQANHQQVRLYACSIGEVSYDTDTGGVYSKNLLSVAKKVEKDFMTVGEAHMHASEKVREEFPDQNPDSVIPRLLSSRQLVLSMSL
jgi:hypothetical protein